MTKLYTAFLFFFLAFPSLALAQSPPGENEVLNYRLIGFTVPAGWAGNDTRIQIATGRYADEKLFIPNIVREKEIHGQRTLIEVPYFGRTYTWRLVKGSGKNAKTSDWHHFATGMSEHADTGRMRLRITAASQLKNPFYVFSDWSKTLYDASGNPVWYLPNIPGAIGENTLVRDLKVSPFGTITFMGGDNIYEIDWNGRILWQGPGNNNAATDGLGIYHHEFTRLANGHYMVLTNETICCNGTEIFKMLESVLPRNEYNRQLGYALHPTRQPSDKCDLYGNVVEYDEKGIIVWQWRSHPYLQQLYGKHLKDEAFSMDAHVNSFCFDASRKLLYVSLRNCNEILKIAYPSGKVVGRYGSGCMGGSGDTLFSGQHALSTLPDGSLLVFDNNTRLPGVHPRAIVMRDAGNALPRPDILTLQQMPVNWPASYNDIFNQNAGGGGNLLAMPGVQFFISDCLPLSDMCIVNRNRKILWSALSEYHTNDGWTAVGQYRASVVASQAGLENVIWSQPKKGAAGAPKVTMR